MASSSNPVLRHFKNNARVYLQSKNGVLRLCEKHIEDEILEGVMTKSSGFVPVLRHEQSGSISRSSSLLTCDFLNMELIDGKTREKEDIIIDLPWNSESLVYIAFQGNDKTFKQQVLVMALQRIQSVPTLTKLLAAKQVPTSQIWENPHLRPGHVLFDNFVTSLLDFFATRDDKEANNLFALFLAMAEDGASQNKSDGKLNKLEQEGIRLVFHGTDHEVMDAILLSGLDPQLRKSQPVGDYFGVRFDVSAYYSKAKTRNLKGSLNLLFFRIIAPTHDGDKVIVQNSKFQLPLAKVALEGAY